MHAFNYIEARKIENIVYKKNFPLTSKIRGPQKVQVKQSLET